MKILITGGLGKMVSGLLPGLSRFYDLRLSHWREPQFPVKYEFIKCDIRNREEVDRAVKGIDVILHLAAKGAKDPENVSFQEALSVNVAGTLNLLESAEKYKIKKFIHISTIWVYGLPKEGVLPEYFPIDEGHPLKPKSPYGVTKLMAENLLRGYSRKAEFSVVTFRLGHTLKKDMGYDTVVSQPCAGWFFQYIDVRDVAGAIRLAIEKDIGSYQVFNLVASDQLFSGKVDTLQLIEKHYPLIRIKNENDFVTHSYKSLMDTGKIRKELGFKEDFPISRYLEWVKSGKKEQDYYGI